MKKLLAILLTLCMVFTMMPITASAESAQVASGTCGDNLTWVLTEDGTLTISGTGRMKDYNSYAMNDKGQMAYVLPFDHLYDKIKVAVVEEGVTYIGDHAFLGATELTSVTFPDSLTEIGDQVFSDCSKLTTINWGTGLTKTGIEVFSYCDALTAVTLPQIDVDYGRSFFSGCANLSSVTIPDTQTTLSETMFRNCKKLTQITLPNSITEIGGKAFEGSGLISIDIPDSVTTMDRGVFYNCDSLTQVEIPGSVSTISPEMFYSCDSLTKVIFHEGTTEMSYGILTYCNNVQEITVPSTVTSLIRTFERAYGLKSVTFLGDAPQMNEQTFESVTATAYYPQDNATWTEDKLQNYSGTITWVGYDNSLASGTWGDNISWKLTRDGTLIVSGEGEVQSAWTNEYPWYGYAQQVTRVIFELGVTNVPEMAFNYAYPNLVSADLKSVEVIGNSAFTQCYALTDVILPDTLKEIETSAFSMTGLTSVDIPQGVTFIGNGAFYQTGLTEIVLPEGMLELGNDVFGLCMELKSAYLPDSITKIGRSLFSYCIALETANIPANLTVMPEAMFDGCSSLKSIEIPDGIEYMYMSNFEGSGLVSVTIPASVKVMGSPFSYCQDLKEVFFMGDAPEIMEYCFQDVVATVYYPQGNDTWTADVMQNYGGTLTWVPYDNSLPCDNGHHVPAKDDSGRNETGFCEYCGIPCRTAGTAIWALEEDGTLILYGTGENGTGEMKSYGWRDYADQIIHVVIEDGITGEIFGFDNLKNLTTVYLSKDITVIRRGAFAICPNLVEVTFPEALTDIGSNAFQGCTSLKEVHLPAALSGNMGGRPFGGCTSLTGIWVDEANPYFTNDEYGVLFSKDMTQLIEAPGALSGHYTIPETVNYIEWAAFDGCKNLTGVDIPDGVTMLQLNLFENCTSLKSLTIPASVSDVWIQAFMGCTALETVTFEGDAPNMGGAFDGLTLTAYYPAGNDTWTEEAMASAEGNVTWVPYSPEERNYVRWYSGTTSLNGTIDLNIYVLLSKDLVEADDTYVRFIYGSNIVDVPMSKAIYSPTDDYSNRYRFSCPIYAKQLADNVTVKFMKGEQQIGKDLNYSVVKYCVNQIAKVTDPQELALYKAMLNYGAAAQLMFEHNVENLANASLSDSDKVLPDVDASAYKYSISGKEEGIRAKSATLMLEDVVKVRVYFALTGTKTIEEFTFTIDGKVVTPQQNDKGYYVETSGIAAKDLEKLFEIQVGGITVKYGALSYVNSKANGSNELEANISKALFVYWQAADSYLG